jgi:flagellar basal body-associated protein FliL
LLVTAPASDVVIVEAPKKSPMIPAVAGVVALLAGAFIGMKVIAPRLGGAAPAAKAEAPKGKEEAPKMVKLENIIVNPADTQGQHFLIVSLVIQVASAETEAKLHAADVPLRDAVNGVLEQMTLDELSAPGARETLRARLKATAIKFAADTTIQIFLPQFLIQ